MSDDVGEFINNGQVSEPSPLLAGLRTGSWLEEQTFAPLQWVVPPLFPEGFSLLIGAPKIGKSWLALSIALSVAGGGYAFSQIKLGRPRHVLLLALEDSDRRLQDRIRKLDPGATIPPLLNYLTRCEPTQVLTTVAAWLETIPARSKPLIILDTLGKVLPVAGFGESQYQRDYKVSGALKRICDNRPGTAVLGLHHNRKSLSDDFVEAVSGTHGLAGAADTVVVIKRQRNETAAQLLVTGRDVEEATYGMRIKDGTTWSIDGPDLLIAAERAEAAKATENLGEQSADIVRFVFEHPEGVSAREVAEAVDMESDDVRVYLSRLVSSDRIRRLERGVYGPAASRAHARTGVTSVTSSTDVTHETHITGGTTTPKNPPEVFRSRSDKNRPSVTKSDEQTKHSSPDVTLPGPDVTLPRDQIHPAWDDK